MTLSQELTGQRAITRGLLCALFVFFSVGSAGAETLWDPDFGGYIGDGSGLRTGATLSVLITPSTQLTLSSSHIDSTEGRLSFSGGSGGDLFDFLPEASSSGTVEVEEEVSYEFRASLTARVTRREEDGLYYLEGRRSLTFNGNREILRISGWFSADRVSSGGTLSFDSLYDAELVYVGPGLDMDEVVRAEDLTEIETGGSTSPSPGAEIPENEEGTEGAGEVETENLESVNLEPETAPTSGTTGPVLTEEKQQELLLRYFNRFLQNLFSTGSSADPGDF